MGMEEKKENIIDDSIHHIFHNFSNLSINECNKIDTNSFNSTFKSKLNKYKKISFIKYNSDIFHNYELIQDKLEGNGIIYHNDGYIFDGFLKNSIPDGYGKLEFPNNSEYIGEWKNGLPNGKGIYESENYKYNGDWFNGYRHGLGEIQLNNESFIVRYHNDNLIEKKTTTEIMLENDYTKLKKRNTVIDRQLQNKTKELTKVKDELDSFKKKQIDNSKEIGEIIKLNTTLNETIKKDKLERTELLNKLEEKEKIIYDFKSELHKL